MTIAEFKALVKTSVTMKTAPNSVPPAVLGARFNELADMVPDMLDGKISKQTVAEQVGGFWVSTGRFAKCAIFDGLTADYPAAENGSLQYRSDLKRLRLTIDGIPRNAATEDNVILNDASTQQQKSAWIKTLFADNISGTLNSAQNDTGYNSFWVNSVAVYAPALLVSNGQIAQTGYLQRWQQEGYGLSLISTQGQVFIGGGNYISENALYRGFVQGVNIGVAGSGGSNMLFGGIIYHTDNTGMRFSIAGSSDINGCNLNATSAIQVDKDDRVYVRGTANAAAAAGDFLLSIDAATGKAAKTRSVSKMYTPTSSADAAGEVGQITYDNNFMYIRLATGWQRTALNTF
jgi:hypothetical protein